MPHTGELREQIVIQSQTETQDGTGDTRPVWSTVRTARAKVEPLRGEEQHQAGLGENATADLRIWIRWDSTAITTEMRITWRSKELDIVSVQNLRYENEWFEILAREHRA